MTIAARRACSRRASSSGVAGSMLMVWAAMGVFGAITSAVNHAWGVEKQPSYFKHKLISFVMLVTASLLLLLGAAAGQRDQRRRGALVRGRAGAARRRCACSRASRSSGRRTVTFIFVVGLVFYFVPNAKVRFRDVWVGAVVTGLAWRGALAGFSWYVRDLSRFSVHGSIAAVVVFLIWVYISAVILLVRRRSHRRLRAAAAPPARRDPRGADAAHLMRRPIRPSLLALLLGTPVAARLSLISVKRRNRDGTRRAAAGQEDSSRSSPIPSVTDVRRAAGEAGSRPARRTEYPYSFSVANYRELNAFALPGGPVWIHRGILHAAANESQLAGVLAHEIAHIAAAARRRSDHEAAGRQRPARPARRRARQRSRRRAHRADRRAASSPAATC